MSDTDDNLTNPTTTKPTAPTQDKPLDKPLVPDPPSPVGTGNNIIYTHGENHVNTKIITFIERRTNSSNKK